MEKISLRTLVFCMTLICLSVTTFAQHSDVHKICGPISGDTQKDLQNVKTFCDPLPKGVIVGVSAMEMLLWVKVNRASADLLRLDPLTTKQLVLNWMKLWKQISESSVVTVEVGWNDVEIASGQTGVFSGDKVTIH